MEIKSATYKQVLLRFYLCMILLLGVFFQGIMAQPVKAYTVKNGKMFIMLGKNISGPSLDSFILQYDLQDLSLKEFVKTGFKDSIYKLGWSIDMENPAGFIISKPLFGVDNIRNPEERLIFTDKDRSIAERFPAVSSGVVFGYNRFQNKHLFAIRDSIVTFYLRGNTKARRVMLAGSFNNWRPDALAMTKTDSGWIAEVKIGPGKYWYKFVVDGNWIYDNDNLLRENDGLGNVNSVFFKPNVFFTLHSFTDAKRVYLSGSFNNWDRNELLMNKTAAGWELPVYLADGTHRYRFVADGKWFADPGNPEQLPNEFGGSNSVIRLGKPYLFVLDGYKEAKQVALAGSFNGWREDELFMKKTATGWELLYTIGPGNYDYKFIVDNKPVHESQSPFVIEPNFTFRLKGFTNAKKVFLAGDFNNWDPQTLPMIKQGDEWVCRVHLTVGKHVYKFIVDDKWITDPANKLWEQNEHNTGNSVLWFDK